MKEKLKAIIKNNEFKLILLIYIIVFVIYIIVDYFNVLYKLNLFVSNINYDLLSIFINALVIIFIFNITYYLIEKNKIKDCKKTIKQSL